MTRVGGGYEKMLNPDINLIYLSKMRKSYSLSLIASLFTLIRFFRKNNLSMIISVQDGPILICLIAKLLLRKKIKIIGWVQNNPTALAKNLKQLPFLLAIKWLYRYLDQLISLSKGVQGAYHKMVPEPRFKSLVIPNIGLLPNDPEHIAQAPDPYQNGSIKILACGRLEPQKNYSLMLRAFALALKENQNLELYILGDGKEKIRIKKTIILLGLSKSVHLLGFQEETLPYFKHADLFLLTSKWEGFGNVIVEAMSMRLPVIATDCPYGPAEIITHGHNGILIEKEDPRLIADWIVKIITDSNLKQKLILNGLQRAKDFTPDVIVNKFKEEVLDEINHFSGT